MKQTQIVPVPKYTGDADLYAREMEQWLENFQRSVDHDARWQTGVYDDLPPTPIIVSKLGATAPTLTNFTSANIQQYTFGVNDYVYGSTELTHGWKEGSAIYPHIHYATQGSDLTDRGIKWELIYSIGNGNSAFSAEATTTIDETVPANTATRTHLIAGTDSTITATDYAIGAYIVWRLRRVATGHANGAPSSNPYGIAVGFHVEIDSNGSRELFLK